jgi:hypothetical protein
VNYFLLEKVMQANQGIVDRNSQDLRVRWVPRCYARAAMMDNADQAHIDRQCAAALIVLSVMTCGAVFLVVHGGWGF